MIIDSHCHLDYPNLYDQLFNVLNRAKRNNVDNLLTICTTLESFEKIKIIVHINTCFNHILIQGGFP